MANIVLDFLHNYQTGERRESEPANSYQYDEGHVLEAVLPEVITSCEIHYWIRGMEESVSTVSENTEEAGQIALEKLRETVARDFLGSEAVYQSFKSLVSREQYASIRTEYVRGWFRDNLDPEFLQPSDEQLEIIANSTGNTLVTARAGSGKTTLSVYRALFLIAALNVPPRTIQENGAFILYL